jgi:hypothetical protein
MDTTNWRTSLHAVALGVLLIGSIWVPAQYQDKVQKTMDALMVTGLLTAADAANLKKR